MAKTPKVEKRKPTVLVVDDERQTVKLIGLLLQRRGYKVIAAASGAQALMKARAENPDLVVLDVMMLGMDGYMTCTLLKEELDIPVILFSGKAMEDDRAMGFQVGAEDYLTKPIHPDELVARCETVLAESGRKDDQESLHLLREEVKRLRRQRQELAKDLLVRINTLETREGQGKTQTISLDELGPLVSGIVHDLRGGLGVISNTAGFMLDELDGDSPLATDLRKIAHTAEFCEVVTRNLIALGGGGILESTEVSLEKVVDEVFFMLKHKLVDVALVVDADPDTPTIIADEGQMKQVFMNLIKNAGEAMPDGGTLTVRIRREEPVLRVEVADTGCGISLENQARLFHELFTTKDRGYGLGLHIVDTIVKRHGGTIEVESKVGEGTTFTLRLPIEAE
jgi:signal transduction histidine kinase